MSICSDCLAFRTGDVEKIDFGYQITEYEHCLFWNWASISAVIPTVPPETCEFKPLMKLLTASKEMGKLESGGFVDPDGWEYFSFRIRR